MGLTARFAETVQPPASGRKDYFDDDPKGLSLRVWKDAKGSTRKVWNLVYRFEGKWCRYRIGDYSKSLGLKDARKEANRLKREIALGSDPNAQRREARQAADSPEPKALTVRQGIAQYIDEYAKKNHKSWKQTEQKLSHALPVIGDKAIADVTRADVHAVLDPIIERNEMVLANRVRAYLNMFFSWAVGRGFIEVPPTYKLPKPLKREESRDRVLTDAEIRDFWRAAYQLGYPFGPFFRMLLLTGQRRSEVSTMRWSEMDGAEAPTLWTIPRRGMKGKNGHEVPLAPMAQAELAALPRFDGVDHVFTSGYVGDRSISGYGNAKKRMDKFCRPSEWTEEWDNHDLRRTVRTRLSQCGAVRDIAEMCIAHYEGGVRKVYDLHAYRDEKRAAFEAWDALLQEILGAAEDKGAPAPAGNIIQLGRARRG